MGQTTGFAAGTWIVRQAARLSGTASLKPVDR